MNKKAEQLYENMLQDMEHCRRKDLGRSMELECLFNMANRYWIILQRELMEYSFEDIREEIFFFKKIKPKFIAQRLYCGLEGNAQLFKESTTDPVALEKFWQQEWVRLEKFVVANASFYEYYKSERTDKDVEWFTRQIKPVGKQVDSLISSMHDSLVSQLLALERYSEYVGSELEMLRMDQQKI